MSSQSAAVDTIKNRIEHGDLKPFDGYSPTDLFLEALSSYPQLGESLDDQLKSNFDWVSKADHEQIFFILNDSAWKRPKEVPFEPKLRLDLIGPKKSPTVSIDL